MGKLGPLVLVIAVLGSLAAEEAAPEKKLEVKTEEKHETAKLEPQQDHGAEERRAYNLPAGYPVPAQYNPNAARANANANANGYAGNPAYPQPPVYTTPGPLSPTLPPSSMIECYTCTDCPHVTKETPTKLCPVSFDPAKSAKCVSYALKLGQMKKKWQVRGCASDIGSCQDIKDKINRFPDPATLLSCNECSTGLCNSGEVARSLPAFGVATLALVIIPLLKNQLLR